MTADVGSGTFRLRPASRGDLLAIVHLLADDSMGAARESDLDMEPYERAFEAIDADPRHLLVVGELVRQGSADTPVVSTFQIRHEASALIAAPTNGHCTREFRGAMPVEGVQNGGVRYALAEPLATNSVSACSRDMPLVSGTLNITKKKDAAANRAYMA
jgi:hypothetical protein